MMRYVIIVAGGKGLRMGHDLPKQFIPFCGKPVLMHTLEVFHQWDAAVRIILVLPADHQAYWQMLCKELNCHIPHRIATGGETRFHSVKNGLQEVPEEAIVGIHDGVRPFISATVIETCFRKAAEKGAVIPVIPLVDSLRQQTYGKSHPVDRSQYIAVQTPQVFHAAIIRKAYQQDYSGQFTDDASVAEADGIEIRTVAGNRENIKITDPFDLVIADALFNQREKERCLTSTNVQ